MQIGVSMYSYFRPWKEGALDIQAFIHEAKRAGADGVELLSPLYRDVESDRAAAMQALEETGLTCPIFSASNNFAQPEPTARADEFKKVQFAVDEACLYRASVVRVFAGDVREGITYEQAREWIVEGLVNASIYAEEKGVKLALENHGQLAGKAEQVLDLIQEVRHFSNSSALGANPDTGNFLLVDQPSHEAVAKLALHANMVHFKDFRPAPEQHEGSAYTSLGGRRYVGAAVGEGTVDLRACVEALRAQAFDGWLSVEYEGEESPFDAVPRSIANARTFI
ncbi:MAG TPA: sugar phosphate isomerase/epimerase family protein [Fimbriimonadaceae bacterium]|nr:sugar phosphate isomerase/epimerase family protein [Fimbriimonadaceae bacterium]